MQGSHKAHKCAGYDALELKPFQLTIWYLNGNANGLHTIVMPMKHKWKTKHGIECCKRVEDSPLSASSFISNIAMAPSQVAQNLARQEFERMLWIGHATPVRRGNRLTDASSGHCSAIFHIGFAVDPENSDFGPVGCQFSTLSSFCATCGYLPLIFTSVQSIIKDQDNSADRG